MSILIDAATYPSEVESITAHAGGVETLRLAERLAVRCFPDGNVEGFRKIWDPETGDELLTLIIRVPEEPVHYLDECDEWALAWNQAAPMMARHLIALSTVQA